MIATGNRCGHNPTAPRFFRSPEDDEPRPPIIYELMERAEQVYSKPGILPTLGYHTADTPGEERQVRSEARERDVALLMSDFYHMDVTSRRVGTLTKNREWTGITLKDLREGTQIAGVRRSEEASAHLARSGVVRSIEVAHTHADGTIRGRPARRQIPIATIKSLGKYGVWLEASKAQYERAKNGGETCAERAERIQAERRAREGRLDSETVQREGKLELIREAVARLGKKPQGP